MMGQCNLFIAEAVITRVSPGFVEEAPTLESLVAEVLVLFVTTGDCAG